MDKTVKRTCKDCYHSKKLDSTDGILCQMFKCMCSEDEETCIEYKNIEYKNKEVNNV